MIASCRERGPLGFTLSAEVVTVMVAAITDRTGHGKGATVKRQASATIGPHRLPHPLPLPRLREKGSTEHSETEKEEEVPCTL